MAEPLRPLSTLDLLHKTFSLYRHHFKLFVGVSLIGPVGLFAYRLFFVSGALLPPRSLSTASIVSMVVGIAVAVTIMLAGLSLSSAAAVKAVDAIVEGRETSVSEAYRAFKGRFWRIIGIVASMFCRAFLGGVLFIAVGVIALALAAALGYNSRMEAGAIGYACGGIAVLAAFLASIGIYVRYAVAVQACVMEDISRERALRRSAFLTLGKRGRVVLVYGAFVSLFLIMDFVLGTPTLLLRRHPIAFRMFCAVAGFVAAALTAPVATIGMSVVYFDERTRGSKN